MSDHRWSMLIDIPKYIGCGNCVRACHAENDVPDGYFRTWVERYLVTDWDMEHPEVISPDGGKEGFPAAKEEANGKHFFVPKCVTNARQWQRYASVFSVAVSPSSTTAQSIWRSLRSSLACSASSLSLWQERRPPSQHGSLALSRSLR